MISTHIVSPFLMGTTSPAPGARPAVSEQPIASEPADVVTTGIAEDASASAAESAGLSGAKRAGVAIMAGVALLGAGLLAPATAHAQGRGRGHYGHSQVYQHNRHRGNRGGDAAVAFGIGVLGGIILGQTLPGPAYPVPVPVPVPVPGPGYPVPGHPGNYGYEGYGCDGYYHRFDGQGHVADQSGHYALWHNQWGQCVRTPVAPHY